MSYATPADLATRFDANVIADLVSDDGTPIPLDELAENEKVLAALEDATAEINASLLAGGRFTVAQLEAAPASTQNYLVLICCCLAIAALHERRPGAADHERIQRMTERGTKAIDALRKGLNVLGLTEEQRASKVTTSGPSVVDIQNRNDLPSRMSRYFPLDSSRLPRN